MKTNEAGIQLIESFEGCRLQAYQDSGGIWTIGYGHTLGVKPGDVITQAQAEQYLREDLADAEAVLNKAAGVDLTPNQFSALVSFQYNTGALVGSTLMRLVNAKDFAGAQAQFGLWVNAGGQKLEGLVRRRAAEAALFGTK
jgi:lysozyme